MANIDDAALEVLDCLVSHKGRIERDPGEVLFYIAEATGLGYHKVSMVVLHLERLGFVRVERKDAPEAHKANRLCAVELID